MGGITWEHHQRLLEIARVAYGSGLTEGSRGGRGYMGVFDDISHARGGSFTTRVVKFLTHKGETCTVDGKPLSEDDIKKLSAMTSQLRRNLYEIAEDLEDDDVLERIRDLLQIDEDGDVLRDAPPLLSRKIVAKVVTEIANATQDARGGDYEGGDDDDDYDDDACESFSWKMVEEAGRAKTVEDTSIGTLFDYLENMWVEGLGNDQRRLLFDIATMVCGSGVREGSRGGRGYVALARDEMGKDLPIKFLTHRDESIEDLTPEQWKQLDRMTDDLRFVLLDIAENAGDRTLKKVRDLLKVNRLGEPTADAPRLLSRKVVAEVVSLIMRVDRGRDGLGGRTFSWEDVAARSRTVVDTNVDSVLSRVDLRKLMPERLNKVRESVDKMRGEDLTEAAIWDHIHVCDRLRRECLDMAWILKHSDGEYDPEDLKKLEDELFVVFKEAEKVRDRAVDKLERLYRT